ncbi:MAG: C40 family peptidase [Bacteroidota bacterium]
MEFGICNLSVIPVRAEPSDKSEMVTQLLFGEHFEIIEKQKNWNRIRIAYDGYDGWMDAKQCELISMEDFQSLNKNNFAVTKDIVQVAILNETIPLAILIGSSLPFYNDRKFKIAEQYYSFEGDVKQFDAVEQNSIIENSYHYLNAPYLWGGRGPFGIDCSGYTQLVFKLSGIKLKRDAHQQSEQGQTVNILEETEPGDLVFFDNEDGKIVHVGILLKKDKVIHASGCVKINDIDHHGIFNKEMNKYTHSLRLIKRII